MQNYDAYSRLLVAVCYLNIHSMICLIYTERYSDVCLANSEIIARPPEIRRKNDYFKLN